MTMLLVLMNSQSRGEQLERGGFTWEEGIYVVLLVEVVNYKGHMLGCDGVLVIVNDWDSNKFCNQLGLYDKSCASSVAAQGRRLDLVRRRCMGLGSMYRVGLRKGSAWRSFFKQSLLCLYPLSYQ